MSSSQTLPDSELPVANMKPSGVSGVVLSRCLRSEIIWLAIIALIIFIVGIVLNGGYWLDVPLEHQNYHVDDMIIGVFIVSFVLVIFLVRGWQEVRHEASERAAAVRQMEQRHDINAQLSQMSSFLQACFALQEAFKRRNMIWSRSYYLI